MKKYSFVLVAIQILFSWGQIFGQENVVDFRGNLIVENVIIVKFGSKIQQKRSAQSSYTSDILNQFTDVTVTSVAKKFPKVLPPPLNCNECIDLTTIYEITYSGTTDFSKLLVRLNSLPYVEYAEPAQVMMPLVSTDPISSTQYHINELQIANAWDLFKGDSTLIIGITDTGFDTDHEDLIYQIAYNYNDPINGLDDDNDGYIDNFRGWDLAMYDNDPSIDNSYHGSIVAGIACAEVNNGKGIAGCAFKTKFLPIKIAMTSGYLTRGYEGIVYAAEHGCKVINCSWGTKGYFSKYGEDVINYAFYNKNAIIVGACGNAADNIPWYPAAFENVLSVAGTIQGGAKWSQDNSEASSGSSWGLTVDIAAPAANYWSTGDNNKYLKCYGGTSFACPIVSAAAALVRGRFPHFTAQQTLHQLKVTTDYIYDIQYNQPYIDQLGIGKVNFLRAITDTSRASIIFRNYNFISKNNELYPGDTIYLIGDFFNVLADAPNIGVRVETSDNYFEIVQANATITDIAKNGTKINENNPFIFVIRENTPFDHKVLLKMSFAGENYHSYQYLTVTINPSSLDFAHSNIIGSATANGLIGYASHNQNDGVGVLFKGNQSIYEAGLIVATSPVNVVSNIGDSWDFHQLSRVETVQQSTLADLELQTTFNDEFATSNKLGIKIQNKVLAWNTIQNCLVYMYDIVNDSNVDIENVYAGLYFDWNIIQSQYNKIDFIDDLQLSYANCTRPNSFYVGKKIMSGNYLNHYALEFSNDGDGYINLSDGFESEEKYFALTNTNHKAGTSTIGSEVADVISAGPFYLKPTDTAHFHIALLWENSLDSLKEKSKAAQLKYDQVFGLYPETHLNESVKDEFCKIWPTIITTELHIEFSISENITVAIIDQYGRNSTTIYSGIVKPHAYTFKLPQLEGGLYFVSVRSAQNTSMQKVIVK